MMKTRLSTLLISAMAPLALTAQTDSLLIADDLNLVVVTGTRTPKTLLKTPVMTSVITRAEIEKADATTLQDILRQNVPGVEFSYSMNQQRHMNFSGFGGQSMLILVDGERLAGETMDDVDFDRLTLSNVDHIEIVKGPVSALYGSNANGGVINIITKNSDKPLKLNVNARVGKHDSQRYGLSWTQGFGKWDNSLDVSRNSSANYDVHSASDPVTRVFSTIYGDNTYNFKEQLAFHTTKDINLKAHAGYFFRQTKRSVDTPERYRDYNGGVKADWRITADDHLYGSYAFDQYDKSNYQSLSKLDIRYYSDVQNAFRMLYNHSFGKGNILTVGSDYMHDFLRNNRLADGTHHQDCLDAFAQYDGELNDIWEVVAALRYDYFSDGSSLQRLTPKLSIRHTPMKGLNVRFGYGMGFRAPSLKEKYYQYDAAGIWIIQGNPELKPEYSDNFNLSLEYHWRNYEFLLDGYHNHVKDKIASGVPYYASKTDRTPTLPYVNLDTYSVSGLEASAKGHWSNGLSASVAYALTLEKMPKDKDGNTANNQYIPARKHALNVHADWEHSFCKGYGVDIIVDGKVMSGVDNVEYVNYYDISQGVANVRYPAYTMWKLMISNRIGKAVKLNVTVDNLLNYKPKYYYLNAPLTDGVNLMAGLSIDIDKLVKL